MNLLPYFYNEAKNYYHKIYLAELANKYQVGKNAIVAAWILKHPAHIQVITGTMSPDHLKDTAKALTVNLTNQEWYDLYLSAGYPLP